MMSSQDYLPTELQSGAKSAPGDGSYAEDTLTLSASAVPPRISPAPNGPALSNPENLTGLGHYELGRELGRGGMGKVYLGRDLRLNRDVAIKILHSRYSQDARIRQRFLEEAQITGQLQNPGVPPIHELGELSDGRPYLVMKLVKGQTLAADLSDWQRQGLGRAEIITHALPTLEKVAQTLAFAHSKGVLHRDLKPANIMVGAFGEVQLMDWGVAKLLGEGNRSAVHRLPPVPETPMPSLVSTDRDPDSETQAGTVMGTPSYMAPEQAKGEIGDLTPAADVFSFGAVLTEILTGTPVYSGTLLEIRAKAELGLTEDAVKRLKTSSAPLELVALAERCLAKSAADRPQDGAAVAQALAEYQAGVAERLRRAELAQAEAQVRAAERRRKRRMQWAFFLVLLLLLAVVLGGWQWWRLREQSLAALQADRLAATQREVALALSQAEAYLRQATTVTDAPVRWEAALAQADAAARQARAAVQREPSATGLLPGIARLEGELAQAQANRRLVVRLDEIAFRHLDEGDQGGQIHAAAGDLADALKANGMPWSRGKIGPEVTAAWVRSHPHRFVVLEALFEWWFHESDPSAKNEILKVLRLAMAESGPLTEAWMRHLDRRDVASLAKLARDLPDAELSPWVVHRLYCHLWELGQRNDAMALIKRGIARFPGDYRLHSRLGQSLIFMNTLENDHQAARELAAAAALRPDAFNVLCCLARIHLRTRDQEAARACLAQARAMLSRATPGEYGLGVYIHLAYTLRHFGEHGAALEVLNLADQCYPGLAGVISQHAWTLTQMGRHEEAIRLARKATEMESHNAGHFNTLGVACMNAGQFAAAEAALRRAIELQPNTSYSYGNLAMLLTDRGRFDEALPLFEKSVALNAHDWIVVRKFIQALLEKRQITRAAELLQHATQQRPDDPAFTITWGRLLLRQQKFAEAETQLRRSVAHYPNTAEVYNLLSIAVGYQGRIDEAVKLLRKAVELDPNHAYAQMNLGGWLIWQGNFAEAAQRIARARQINPSVKSETPERKPRP